MTVHFAYPNVIPHEKRFIGCGRYTVFAPNESPPDGYLEVEETPNTPNRLFLENAIELLGPDSFDSESRLYEKRDSDYRYQGDSLDLAYFLAHIHRARAVHPVLQGSIWCTGVVQVVSTKPILHKVDSVGFGLKLSHFLSGDNRDCLFIVPAANLNNSARHMIRDHHAELVSLNRFRRNPLSSKNGTKTIISVRPHELPDLVQFIFKSRIASKIDLKWLIAMVMAAIIFVSGGWWVYRWVYGDSGAPDQSTPDVMPIPTSKPPTVTPALPTEKPIPRLKAQVMFQYKIDGQKNAFTDLVESEQLRHLLLTHRDRYRIRIDLDSPSGPLYLYVFQLDDIGSLDPLFPHPDWGTANPVQPNQWPCRIPSDANEWLYLDQLSSSKFNRLMNETLFVLIQPHPATEIEILFARVQTEMNPEQRLLLIEKFTDKMRSIGRSTKHSFFFREWSFRHGR